MKILLLITTICILLMESYASSTADISQLSFLKGCWVGDVHGSEVKENWSGQSGGLMLGNSKTVKNGTIESFEFLRIEKINSEILYTPYIKGVKTISFKLKEASGSVAKFENLKNDFPQVIKYEINGKKLEITLSGNGQEFQYSLESKSCR